MKSEGVIKIVDTVFRLSELDALQVIEELKRLDDPPEPHELDWLLGEKYIPVDTLNVIADADVGKFWKDNKLKLSEIEPLYKKAVEINPFLSRALRKKIEAMETAAMGRVNTMFQGLSQIFEPASSALQTQDTPTQGTTDTATS